MKNSKNNRISKRQMRDSINSKYELSEKNILNMDVEIIKEQWTIINDFLKNGDLQSYEDMQSVIDSLYLLCTETGFLDNRRDFLNKGNGLRGNNGIFGIMKEYIETEYCENSEVKKKGKELLVRTKDINDQFYFLEDDQRPRSELLANMMLLSNSMAHLVDTNDISKMFTEEGQESKIQLKDAFYEIKERCIEELINCKQSGEDIFIEKIIYDGTDAILVAIPGYFEPFCVHLNNVKLNLDEYDSLQYFNYNISKMDMLITTFPLKISEEKDSIIREYMNPYRTDPNELNGIRDRLLWYINTQDRFKEIREGKMKQEPKTVGIKENDMQDKKEVKFKKVTTSPTEPNKDITKKRTRNKRPEKAEKFKEINRVFLESLNEQLGGIIGPTMIDKFLNRASYSFEALINGRLKAIATPFFKDKDLDELQMNKELLKIFIYIRMFSKISMINNSRIDDENSIEVVRNAFGNYETAFEFMQKNKDGNLSYDDMQKGITKYIESREERESEEKQFNETQDVEEIGVEEFKTEDGEMEKEDNSNFENEEQIFKKLKGVTESIVGAKEIKSLAKDSIEVLKRRKKEIEQLIKQNEDQINRVILSGESQETVLEQIKALRELIKEQKALKKEIKRKIKQFKLQKKQAKYDIKESQKLRGESIDRL